MATKIDAFVDLDKLRGLRSWHWRAAIRFGQAFNSYPTGSKARMDCMKANTFHMQAVQALNDLFPVDDTAERDMGMEGPV